MEEDEAGAAALAGGGDLLGGGKGVELGFVGGDAEAGEELSGRGGGEGLVEGVRRKADFEDAARMPLGEEGENNP